MSNIEQPTTARFSERAAALGGDTSSAWAVQDAAVARAAAGEDILFLTVGDPDQPTPAAITRRAVESINAGRTHYSPVAGEPLLRAAVARSLTRSTARQTQAEEIVIFPGAQNALFSVVLMLADAGDEIIVLEPYYATYPGVLAAAGARLVPAPTRATAGFAFDINSVLSRIGSRTKAILFSSPNNPTGATVDAHQLAELGAACAARGIWMIADEVYSNLSYDSPHVSAWSHGAADWTVVINSMSKTYAMTGWRLGWAAGPRDLAVRLAQLAAASQFGCAQFVQDTAAQTLDQPCAEAEAMRAEYRRRRDLVTTRLNAIDGLHAISPAGGMFVMLDVSAVDPNDVAFAYALLETERIAVIPGSGFGPSARGCVRISLTQPVAVLERALLGIERFAARCRRSA